MKIRRFKPKYVILSMEYPCSVVLDGIVYPNAMRAFAACRFLDRDMREKCVSYDETTLAYIISDVVEGPLVKEGFRQNMFKELCDILFQKFKDKELSDFLLSTGEEPITYINKNDLILGCYNDMGLDLLGTALTYIRYTLRNTTPDSINSTEVKAI